MGFSWANRRAVAVSSLLASTFLCMSIATLVVTAGPRNAEEPRSLGIHYDEDGQLSFGLANTKGGDVTMLPYTMYIGGQTTVQGRAAPKRLGPRERVPEQYTYINWRNFGDEARIRVKAGATSSQVSIALGFTRNDEFYGIWEYPYDGKITSTGYGGMGGNGAWTNATGFDGSQTGISHSSARTPFFFSSSGFGVYFHTDTNGTFEFTSSIAYNVSAEPTVMFKFDLPELEYTVIYNRNLTAMLSRFSELSSRPLMPSDASFGPIFWSDDFSSDFHGTVKNAQDNINDLANKLAENGIRATAIVIDRPYGTGNSSWGNFDFDPKNYPDPSALVTKLAARGYGVFAWVANRAFLNTELYRTASQNKWLFPNIDPVHFDGPALNLSIPEAYSYLKQKLAFLPKLGVRGFKIDRGDEHEMPDREQNKQANLFNKMCFEVMKEAWGNDTRGYFSLARSAYDKDRSVTAVWNGDSEASYTGLRYSVASGIRAGLIGYSNWGSDTGGYLRNASRPNELLFSRWMFFSAWSPIYEILVGSGHTPWYNYSKDLVADLRHTASRHTQLVPYLRSFAYIASQTGIPIMRALFLEYPDDDKAYVTHDRYHLGSAYMVAPLLDESGTLAFNFPAGPYKFYDEERRTIYKPGDNFSMKYAGRQSETPYFIREGSIIPTGDIFQGNFRDWPANNSTGDKRDNYTLPSFGGANWKPSLTVSIYASYNFPQTNFTYYRGKEATQYALPPGPVGIYVKTDKARKVFQVTTGVLGVPTRVDFHIKPAGLVQTFNLPAAGGEITLTSARSLFD